MSKNVALFIDVANIYYAARGQDVDVDYIALLKHATKGRDLIRAYAYSGLDPENENQRKFLDFLSKNGYKVVHKDIRKFGDGRVKANLDIELVVDLFRLQDRMDIAVIVSGDGDFASAIRALQDVGVRCEVISFRPNTSSDLIAVADEFTDIMKIIGIGRAKESKRMSMPEMPAKEVNPEFGFREASRGVAAAALAALREGDKPARAPRRRSSRQGAAEEQHPADEEAVATAAPAAEAERENGDGEGTRRRRRRRGGRGRGRGRRGGEQTAESPEPGEVGWQEFEDISELTDLGDPGAERSYSFQEADEETLAALGLAPSAEGGTPEPPAAEGKGEPAGEPSPATRRRTRTTRGRTTAAEGTDSAETEATGASETPRRGRSRTKAAQEPASAPDEGTGSEPNAAGAPEPASKPARRTRSRRTQPAEAAPGAGEAEASAEGVARPKRSRRTRAAGADAPAAPADGDGATGEEREGEEGIWQRFRSARQGTRRTS